MKVEETEEEEIDQDEHYNWKLAAREKERHNPERNFTRTNLAELTSPTQETSADNLMWLGFE